MVPNLRPAKAASLLSAQAPRRRKHHEATSQELPMHPSPSSSTTSLSSAAASSTASSDDKPEDINLAPLQPLSAFPNVETQSHAFSKTAAGAIGPTAVLVGGTAAMYTSLLRHPSTALTPWAIFYMLLLAIQTSIQPRLSRKYIAPRTNKVQVALTEEVIKTSVASLVFWGCSPRAVLQEALQGWTIQSSLLVAGVPATLYALQGVLTYMSHQHLDSVTFNGLSQTKTLWAALCCFLVMRKPQSPLQMVALGLLFVSALLFQTNTNNNSSVKNMSNTTTDTTTTTTTTSSRHHHQQFFLQGVIPCLGATFLSGLAGAFSQRGLQMVGGSGRNAFLYTVEVSFFSAIALLVTQGVGFWKQQANTATVDENNNTDNPGKNVESNANQHHRHDTCWTWQTLIPITCKAMGGILTALVHKHAGSVVKGFALMLGLVMSGILQSLWIVNVDPETNAAANHNSQRLSMNQVWGIAIVMLSSWLHFTNPPAY